MRAGAVAAVLAGAATLVIAVMPRWAESAQQRAGAVGGVTVDDRCLQGGGRRPTAPATPVQTRHGNNPATTYFGYDAANRVCWSGPTSGSGCTSPTGDAAYLHTANAGSRSDGTTTMHDDLAGRVTSATAGATTDTRRASTKPRWLSRAGFDAPGGYPLGSGVIHPLQSGC